MAVIYKSVQLFKVVNVILCKFIKKRGKEQELVLIRRKEMIIFTSG